MQKTARSVVCLAAAGVVLGVAAAQQSTSQRILPREEPVPVSPVCDNCHMTSGSIYECAHFTTDPSEPCDPSICIENTWISAICDYHPGGTLNLCAAVSSSNPADWLVRQHLRRAVGGCFTTDTGGFHEAVRITGDCRSCPSGSIILEVRCVTDAVFCAAGVLIDSSPRGLRRVCGCVPQVGSPDEPIDSEDIIGTTKPTDGGT